ncbi:MAG: hypothetical protein HKP42_07465 [Maribacter sp.]|nr:hypothetical protein [Maribacter sp.]MBT8300288.1 hypothetical protein [Maribacter sp.]NND78484.1 hypothetical protein [Maribacter sp.]NNK75886.1 hypothetical protein [Maribacter sp.]
MNINKNILIVLFLLFTTTLMFGQRRPDKEKIKSLKVAYITEQLNLSSKEAQAFWPIYNAHEEKMESLNQQERTGIFGKVRDMDALDASEVEELLDDLMALQEAKQKANLQFLRDIRTVISAKKTFVLLKTENGFKRRLLQQYRQKQGGGLR